MASNDETGLTPNREIWDEIQHLRAVLDDRNALCSNCGCLLEDNEPHAAMGMGWCTIGSPRTTPSGGTALLDEDGTK